MTVGSES